MDLPAIPDALTPSPTHRQMKPPANSFPAAAAAVDEQRPSYSLFSLAYYRSLFNVDTVTVLERIFYAMQPYRGDYLNRIERPDLYGYVWISITLIFALTVFENLASYFGHMYRNQEKLFFYDLEALPIETLFILIFMVGAPLVLWSTLMWLDDFDVSLPKMFCLYGYAMFVYVIAAVICAVPIGWVRWFALLLACAGSTAQILHSLWPSLVHKRLNVQLLGAAIVVLANVSLTLFIRLYSFHVTSAAAAPTVPQ